MTTTFATAFNADMLEAIFAMNGWRETEITCPDGVTISVTPCSYLDTICSSADCEYFLVYADIPYMGANNLTELAERINGHADALKELKAERYDLRCFFEKHEKNGWSDDDWSCYSDWHKDLYGYRPHGHVCGEYVEPYKGACISNRYSEYTGIAVTRGY